MPTDNALSAGLVLAAAASVFVGSEARAADFAGSISTQGKALITSDDQARFVVRGVALASNNHNKDLLGDNDHEYFAQNILPRLLDLNVNAVRVYNVDLSQGHDSTMNLLQQNGIYVLVGMATEQVSVNRVNPNYSAALQQRVIDVIDAFSGYDNILGYSVGNEVVFPGNIYDYVTSLESPPQCSNQRECIERTVNLEKHDASVIKALIRDAKAHLQSKGLNTPVGVAMQDGPESTLTPAGLIGTDVVAQYYACGDTSERADFIGVNSYRYVPGGPMSSYDGLAQEVSALPVPVYLTESGAVVNSNNPQTRDWKIVTQNYTRPILINNLSGEVAYEFFNEPNNFGLYTEDAALTETAWGGAQALGDEFAQASTMTVAMPSPNPASVDCPSNFDPEIPELGQTIQITIKNYADQRLKAVQNDTVLATLDDAINGTPSATDVRIHQLQELFILNPPSFDLVCNVPAGSLQDGWIVLNNVAWGNTCNTSR